MCQMAHCTCHSSKVLPLPYLMLERINDVGKDAVHGLASGHGKFRVPPQGV